MASCSWLEDFNLSDSRKRRNAFWLQPMFVREASTSNKWPWSWTLTFRSTWTAEPIAKPICIGSVEPVVLASLAWPWTSYLKIRTCAFCAKSRSISTFKLNSSILMITTIWNRSWAIKSSFYAVFFRYSLGSSYFLAALCFVISFMKHRDKLHETSCLKQMFYHVTVFNKFICFILHETNLLDWILYLFFQTATHLKYQNFCISS